MSYFKDVEIAAGLTPKKRQAINERIQKTSKLIQKTEQRVRDLRKHKQELSKQLAEG